MSVYHRPPDGYEPPTHCARTDCGDVIFYAPVIGGRKWQHLGSPVGVPDHEVVMRPEGWWDTATGQMRYGIADQALEDALAASAGSA